MLICVLQDMVTSMQTNMVEVIKHTFVKLTEKVSSEIQASNTAQEVTCFHTLRFFVPEIQCFL
jgi:hypothetical protein